jgi:7-cyano-7-deazaguanine synthase
MKKKAIVVHSGGMDSSICLAAAVKEFGATNVLSLSFSYSQRHSVELERAKKIATQLAVDNIVIDINCLGEITQNALIGNTLPIVHTEGREPNTLVVGRNGLMARLAAIHADHLGAKCIYMGVIEVEAANSGYRDCSRKYMDMMQEILRLDLNNDSFELRTPISKMTKFETMKFANELGVLEFFLENTITCYQGVEKFGCGKCPACKLRNDGIKEFIQAYPSFDFSYRDRY